MHRLFRAAIVTTILPLMLVAASFATAQAPTATGAASSAPVSPSGAFPAPSIAASSFVLVDMTSGQTLLAQNADEKRDPASLTKLMTAYLTFGALRQKAIVPSQMVNVSQKAWKASGSRMFIEPRKSVSVDELMKGMIIQSGNDASIALAELVGGSEEPIWVHATADWQCHDAQLLTP